MDEPIRCSPEPSKSEPIIVEDSGIEKEHQFDPIQYPADHECQVSSSAVTKKSENNQSPSSSPPRIEVQPVESSSYGNTEIEPVSLIDQIKTSSNLYSIESDENRWTEPFDVSSINRSDNDASLNESSYVYDTVTSSTGDDDADYDSFQSLDDKVLSEKSQDTSDKDSSQSYDQVECIHHRLLGSCDDCLRKIWSCTRPRKMKKKKRPRHNFDSSDESQITKDDEDSAVKKKQKLMQELSSSPIQDIFIAKADEKESTILQVDQNTTDHCHNEKLSDSENIQIEDEINESQQQPCHDKSSKHESQDINDKVDTTKERNKPTKPTSSKNYPMKKKSKLSLLPIPTDYLLITCSKEETLLKLIEGVRRGNVAKSKNRYCYIQVDNKPIYRAQTSTQYKNLFVMMARLREIETVENFTARIQFGFSYIYRNDVVTKNFSSLQQVKAGHFLPSINGMQFPIRGKRISPDSIQRAIDIAFNPSFQPHVGRHLFNQIIYKRNLLEAEADRIAERSYEHVTYEVTMKDEDNSVYIFRQRQQQNRDKKYSKKHANTGHRVVVEKRPETKWLSVHVARGADEEFDLKYDLFYSNRTPSDMECPFVLNNLGQIHEPIKIRKKFRQMISNVKKFDSTYHESSFKTTNKAATISSFWDSAIMIIQEITEYDEYNPKRGVFKSEKMTVESKLELSVDEWFDDLVELVDEDYLSAVAKEFYRLGIEASMACKRRTHPKNEAGKKLDSQKL